jgi:hypothetical protein
VLLLIINGNTFQLMVSSLTCLLISYSTNEAHSADILNYALTLEHLEDTFYREGLANFSQADFASAGYKSTFYNNIKEVSSDETTHVSFLTTALKAAGAKPVDACTYAFGVKDVHGFLALASILEGIFHPYVALIYRC